MLVFNLPSKALMFLTLMIFFFQAEDGIRDGRVTGVQTCALPIYRLQDRVRHQVPQRLPGARPLAHERRAHVETGHPERSEERRVGKEWRSRGLTLPLKKKKLLTQMRACRVLLLVVWLRLGKDF